MPIAAAHVEAVRDELRKTIDLNRTRPSSPTTFEWATKRRDDAHLVVDGDRNAVSMTTRSRRGMA